jgi:hypothetical protein
MSTISTPHARHGTQTRHDRPVPCGSCPRDVHQIINTIEPPGPAGTDVVEVSSACTDCDSFFASAATVFRILNRSATVHGILQFGGEYVHCGEPMKTQGADLRSIYAPMHTDRPSAGLLEVYLRTKVLHCGCGFQMEIAHEEGTGGRRTG